jgi:hypothetical protein
MQNNVSSTTSFVKTLKGAIRNSSQNGGYLLLNVVKRWCIIAALVGKSGEKWGNRTSVL